jgi:hypothetical protein
MSIERRRRSDGRAVYVVRWYESGRDSTRRRRTFDRRRDAELFEASVRRARQLGQLAAEVIGSNATLEEFLVEWWDTYAVTHLRPNTLATYTTLLDKWIVPYLGRKRLREINRETIDVYAARLRVDGAGAALERRVDALRDVGALLPDGGADAAGGPVEPLRRAVVADGEHGVPHDLRDLDVRLGRHLTRDVHQAGRHHRLDGDAAAGVLPDHRVEDRVADLVRDLVGVTLGHGFGGEKASGHGVCCSWFTAGVDRRSR